MIKNISPDAAVCKSYSICEAVRKRLEEIRAYFTTEVERFESELVLFTYDEQTEILDIAEEIAFEPRVWQLMCPHNLREQEIEEAAYWLSSIIIEYEEIIMYETI